MEKIIPRVRDGVESDTHFIYTDPKGREWSVVDIYKMMSKVAPESEMAHSMGGYMWEGMYFGEEELDCDQFRGITLQDVTDQIKRL